MSSSGGALLSLAAQGPQDVFLTGNPDTSYFRQVYKRHTNFAMAQVRQPIEGAIAAGNVSKFTLSRQGDMVSYIYLRRPDAAGMLDNVEYVKLKIGGQEIVKMTAENLSMWGQIMANGNVKSDTERSLNRLSNILPLHFWFCDYYGASLPLCALSYHDVEVEVKWTGAPSASTEAWANMIWLDNSEREYFVQSPKLTYLIDQWQNSDPIGLGSPAGSGTRNRIDLNFNHPVRALIMLIDQDYGDTGSNTRFTDKIKLSTSGVEISKLANDQMLQSIYWHNLYAQVPFFGDYAPISTSYYSIIPFALNLGSNQPSGTLNFSRLENVQLSCDENNLAGVTATSAVAAVNTNVLIIRNGMGGLEFSN